MTVDEALHVLGLTRHASKDQVQAELRSEIRTWSQRVGAAPTASQRQKAEQRVAELDAAGIALQDWQDGSVGPRPRTTSVPASPLPPAPTMPQRPTVVPNVPQVPSVPPFPAVPGWTIDSSNRWVCNAHYIRDCPNCYHPGRGPQQTTSAKRKGVAILLAILFGPLAWIYTWQRDKKKFWANLALTVMSVGLWFYVAWIWVLLEACFRPQTFYQRYPNG